MGVENTKGLRKRMKERAARRSIMVICISCVTERMVSDEKMEFGSVVAI